MTMTRSHAKPRTVWLLLAEFITMMSKKPEALRHPEEIREAFKVCRY